MCPDTTSLHLTARHHKSYYPICAEDPTETPGDSAPVSRAFAFMCTQLQFSLLNLLSYPHQCCKQVS